MKGTYPIIILNNTDATINNSLSFKRNGRARWTIRTFNQETGVNIGSDLGIFGADDSGAFGACPQFIFQRKTGYFGVGTGCTATADLDIYNNGALSDLLLLRSSAGATARDMFVKYKGGTLVTQQTWQAGTTSAGAFTIRETGQGDRVTLTTAGNVGIGTSAPSQKLHIVGNLRAQGTIDCTLGYSSGGASCTSDIRLKENVRPIQNALEKLKKISGYEFEWSQAASFPGRHDIGLIAQDVEPIFPTAVADDSSTGLKKVNYSSLVAPLIESIRDLDGASRGSEAKLQLQKKRLHLLRARLFELQKLRAQQEKKLFVGRHRLCELDARSCNASERK